MEALFVVLAVVAPIAGLVLASRHPGATPARLVLGATLGGLTAGILFAAATVARHPDALMSASLIQWTLTFAALGLLIGVVVALVRVLSSWAVSR